MTDWPSPEKPDAEGELTIFRDSMNNVELQITDEETITVGHDGWEISIPLELFMKGAYAWLEHLDMQVIIMRRSDQ